MVKQTSLFPDVSAHRNNIVLAIPGSAPALNRAQKQFNKLVDEIAILRKRLAAWQDYPAQYQQRIGAELEPLHLRLREARIAMAMLFDRFLGGKNLTRHEKGKVRELLTNLVSGLLEDESDPALEALAARHGLALPTDDGSVEVDMLESLGSEIFGVDLDADHGATTPEELTKLFAKKAAAEAERRDKPRKKSDKTQAREAQAERAAKDASQALREVYRKLARDLHPDRIADADERAHKTAMMQDANRAYEARDLLALLELQLRIEQIDPAHMADLAEEKLAHFNHVLREQAQCLREEIDMHTMPFVIHFEHAPPRDLYPKHVERELDGKIVQMQTTLRELQTDLRRYANLAELKRDLKHYTVAPVDEDFDALLDALAQDLSASRRRKR